jgi:hypothetical protein
MIAAIIIDGFAYYIEIVVRRDGQEPGSGKEVNFCLRAVSTATSLTEPQKRQRRTPALSTSAASWSPSPESTSST